MSFISNILSSLGNFGGQDTGEGGNYGGIDWNSPSQQQFPTQDFRSNSFGSMMNPFSQFVGNTMQGYQQAPATQSYMNFLSQGAPTREEYKPSLGRNIFGALAGIASSFGGSNPAETASSIINAPYLNALHEYNQRGASLGEAQKVEQGALGFGQKYGADAGQLSLEAQKIKYQYDQLAQQGNIAGIEANLRARGYNQTAVQIADKAIQDAAQNKLRSREIGIQQQRANTDERQANWQMSQLPVWMRPNNMFPSHQGQGTYAPNAAMSEDRFNTSIYTDSRFAEYIGRSDNGQPYINWRGMPPELRAIAQQLQQQVYSQPQR